MRTEPIEHDDDPAGRGWRVTLEVECPDAELPDPDDFQVAVSLALAMHRVTKQVERDVLNTMVGDVSNWRPTGVQPVPTAPPTDGVIAAGFAAPPPTYLSASQAWRQHQVGQSPLTEATLAELRRQAANETNLRAEQWWRAQRARDVAGWSGHRPMRNEWLEPYPKGWP